MVTPSLWGDKGWHLAPPEPNSALWLPPLFTPLAELGLLLHPRLVSRGVPMETGKEIWKEKHKRGCLIWIWTKGRREGSSRGVETPGIYLQKVCFQFVNLFIFPVSWLGGQKLSRLWCWGRRNIFFYKFREKTLVNALVFLLPPHCSQSITHISKKHFFPWKLACITYFPLRKGSVILSIICIMSLWGSGRIVCPWESAEPVLNPLLLRIQFFPPPYSTF